MAIGHPAIRCSDGLLNQAVDMESRATRGNFETTEEVGAPGQQRRPSGSGLGPLSAGRRCRT
jgi:hypothetical protein